MKENKNYNLDKLTLKSLKVKLREIGQPEVPMTLKTKLLNTIPKKLITDGSVHPVRPWLGTWSFGATAATVLILALIIIVNFGPSVPSQKLVADINDRINNYPNDLNVPSIEDINYVNYNIQWQNLDKAGIMPPQ